MSDLKNTLVNKKEDNKRRKRKGFTLIELIVVIAILGILSAVAIPRFSGFQESARKKADIANAKNIATIISTMVADEKITTSVTTPALVSSIANIEDYLPNGAPALQTTAVKSGNYYYYTVNVSTGEVVIYAASSETVDADNKLYPSAGSTFQ